MFLWPYSGEWHGLAQSEVMNYRLTQPAAHLDIWLLHKKTEIREQGDIGCLICRSRPISVRVAPGGQCKRHSYSQDPITAAHSDKSHNGHTTYFLLSLSIIICVILAYYSCIILYFLAAYMVTGAEHHVVHGIRLLNPGVMLSSKI